MTEINALRDEFSTLHKTETDLQTKVETEKRDFSQEETEASDLRFKRMAEIKNVMDRKTKLASEAFSNKAGNVELPKDMPGEKDALAIRVGESFDATHPNPEMFRQPDFNRAMNQWGATGRMIDKFATITSATDGGILLPVSVDEIIVPLAKNTFREAMDVYDLQPIKTPGTETINEPVTSATAGGVVAENAVTETEQEPGFSESFPLVVQTYQSGSSWISWKQLLSLNYDMIASLLPALEYQKELGLESAIASTIAADSNITQSVTTATTNGLTYSNLNTLDTALPKRFNNLKVMILNKAAYVAAKNMQTTTGYPILTALDPQNNTLKAFNGTPVLWTDYFSGFGANNVVGIIVSHMGFRLRDASQEQVQRFTQTSTRPAQTGFNLYGFHAYGYSPLAICKLVCPAS